MKGKLFTLLVISAVLSGQVLCYEDESAGAGGSVGATGSPETAIAEPETASETVETTGQAPEVSDGAVNGSEGDFEQSSRPAHTDPV